MWKLSIEDDQGATTVVQLARAEYTIGRGEENTIRLTERNISRRHARLMRQNGHWFLVDLGSYNGCFVNGIRTGESQVVGPKDLLQLGDYRLEFITDESLAVTRGGPRADASQSIAPGSPYDSSQDRLVMVVGPTPGREYPLSEQTQLLGRGDDCEITVNHPSVSRHHAEIHHVKDHHYEIIDKKSSNGLRINGVELQRGLVEAHDVIEFGDIVLKFIPAGEVYRPTPEESEKIARMLGVSDEVELLSHSARLKLAWSGMSRGARASVSVLGILVFGMFVAVVVSGRLHTKQKANQSAPANSVMRMVQSAHEKATADNLEEAHRILAKVPLNSPVRNDPTFRDVQSRWADWTLERATNATTNEEKRAIYETLIGESTLDEAHRNRARDNLNLLNERIAASQALAAATALADASAPPPDTEPQATTSTVAVAKPLPPSTKQPSSTRTAAKASSGYNPTPVAQNANAAGRAMAPIIAEKNRLKAKVASGDSTDSERRYLRALCRQLNDSSCSR
jgi:pSer/pThr/pTyr-binding forkhead associated (FHA) protein